MPRISHSQQIGRQAAAAVTSLFERHGCVVDQVVADFGEDLAVQTHHQGVIDPYRIFVQVKGTAHIGSHRRGKGAFEAKVSTAHAIKWTRFQPLFVVVLWDTAHNRGYWCEPRRQFMDWTFPLHRHEELPMTFRARDVLNASALRAITWMARLRHYNSILCALRADDEVAQNRLDEFLVVNEIERAMLRRALLTQLGLIRPDGQMMPKALAELRRLASDRRYSGGREMRAVRACMLVCLRRLKAIHRDLGMPGPLIAECCEPLKSFIEKKDAALDFF